MKSSSVNIQYYTSTDSNSPVSVAPAVQSTSLPQSHISLDSNNKASDKLSQYEKASSIPAPENNMYSNTTQVHSANRSPTNRKRSTEPMEIPRPKRLQVLDDENEHDTFDESIQNSDSNSLSANNGENGSTEDQDIIDKQARKSDEQATSEAKRKNLTEAALKDVETAKEMMRASVDGLYELKMKELDLEEQLIMSGTHPDYIQGLLDIEERHKARQIQVSMRHEFAKKACEADLDAEEKLAIDSFNCNKKAYLDRFMTRFKDSIKAHERELRHHFSFHGHVPIINSDPILIYEQKRSLLDSYDAGLRDDYSVPEWTRKLVRSRQHAGYSRICVPLSCEGLDDQEMEEDLEFMKIVNDKSLKV